LDVGNFQNELQQQRPCLCKDIPKQRNSYTGGGSTRSHRLTGVFAAWETRSSEAPSQGAQCEYTA